MKYLLIGGFVVVILGLTTFLLNIKNSVKVDDKMPFLNDDCDW
jgi:hypothetical protein